MSGVYSSGCGTGACVAQLECQCLALKATLHATLTRKIDGCQHEEAEDGEKEHVVLPEVAEAVDVLELRNWETEALHASVRRSLSTRTAGRETRRFDVCTRMGATSAHSRRFSTLQALAKIAKTDKYKNLAMLAEARITMQMLPPMTSQPRFVRLQCTINANSRLPGEPTCVPKIVSASV